MATHEGDNGGQYDRGDSGAYLTLEEVQRQNEELHNELDDKNAELQSLHDNLTVAINSIKTFHDQQRELYAEFVALHKKYAAQKTRNRATLWDFLPAHCPGFDKLPLCTRDVYETEDFVDSYKLLEHIGEGQFGEVRRAQDLSLEGNAVNTAASAVAEVAATEAAASAAAHGGDDSDDEVQEGGGGGGGGGARGGANGGGGGRARSEGGGAGAGRQQFSAVKIIDKYKITDTTSLTRIVAELSALQTLDHPNVLTLVDVIHSTDYLYIITECVASYAFVCFFHFCSRHADDRSLVIPMATSVVGD
jgi:serine/threonine protein kinase